ncbi:hypothetical protein J437_LFUL012503 [Ladona fulva]|uniref:Transmembrane protein 199 n=1 Tax=Ladona fulva TaxID=123851 RepID=A0A8K0K2G1_LADFU|nr:hypothetical protein J437_LFUL012503 [Ladona fulva]
MVSVASMESIKDPTVKIIPSERLQNLINNLTINDGDDQSVPKGIMELRKRTQVGEDQRNSNDETAGDVLFTVEDVEWLLNQLRENVISEGTSDDSHGHCLHSLLEDSELILPSPKPIERNPILEKRIQRLKREQDEREYKRMTRNVDTSRKHEPQETISYQMQQINRQLIAVFQFVLSVAAGFAFGFLGVELIVGSLDFGFRLLLGIICALIIALAEIYFLAKQLADDIFPPENFKLHQD